jgi:hypothetical protein
MINKDTAKFQVEEFIDQFGLPATLDMLAEIASEKADHLRSNWQDNNAAACWERAANHLRRTSGARPIMETTP